MIKMIYFSFAAFTTLVVRGHRRTKLRGHRRTGRKRKRPVGTEREEERGDGAEPRFILPLQPPDEHPPDHHAGGVTEQLKTAGSATFITYTLILGNRNYHPSTDRW